jgi:uncharacterized protein (TIGR03437 family)
MNRLSSIAAWCGVIAFCVISGVRPLAAQTGNAIVQTTLTPPSGSTGTLAANDDDSTDAVPLGIGGANGINFFGNNYTQVYVNNNGNLTFTGPLSQFTPNGLSLGVQCDNSTGDNCPIIAPFFADVDTTGTGSGLVMYGNATVNGFPAFIANYINVGYFASENDKLNSFQVILLDRSDTGAGNFDIEFNYNNILWETGDASDGTDGLGGISAAVGYSNGGMDPNNIYFQLTGSLVNGALLNGGPNALATHSVNSSVPGRYIFPVRAGAISLLISNITCTPTNPGPGTTSSCKITLNANAPAGAATTVTLSSNNAAVTVPASVNIPAGSNTATFTASVGSVSGNQQATITATLGGIAQTASLTIGSGSGGISITTTTIPGVTISTAASQTLGASGGSAPYTWRVIGGTVPPGLTFSSSGVLSGTPTRAGTYSFTVKVTDAGGNSATQTINITVAPQSVTITTPSPLPSAMATVQYPTQVLSATGGFAPYTFALASGSSLPSGLTLSAGGAISGTPATAGSSRFTITVSDSNSPAQTGTATFSITVRPFSPDLLLSSGSLSFTLPAGATALPPNQNVPVEATDPTKILNWSAAINPSVSWLALKGGRTGSTTPGAFQVVLTAGGSQLAASPTPYTATVVVSCLAPSPCAGNTQNVTVNLLVSTVSPQLTPLTNLLSFNTASANPQTSTQPLSVQNTGGGTISFTSVSCGARFCVPAAPPSPIGGGATANINVQANPAGLAAGFYFTQLTIVSSAGTVQVPVTLLIQGNPSLVLSPSGVEINVPAGGLASTADTKFLVNISGAASAGTSVPFTAQLLPGAPWLTLVTSSGSSTTATPGAINYKFNSNVSSLAAGAYYATIQVKSGSVVNSPQDFHVVLNVQAAAAPQAPIPTPAGLIFTGTPTSVIPAQQTTLYASVSAPVPYQASAATNDGGNWLSVSPATGTTSGASPASVNVTVNTSGLTPGIYQGTVTYALAAASVPAVNVTLIVQTPPASLRTPEQLAPQATTCTPSKVVPTETGLVTNFSNAAAWPTPLEVQLSDDCGVAIPNGRIVTTFSNGDPPLILLPEDSASGYYSGTWTPKSTSAQVTVTAQASATGLTSATTQVSGSIIPNAAPVIFPGGDVHAFTPQSGQSLAPGTWMAIYGTNLANQLNINQAAVFPTSLSGTSVIIGGEQTPLEFVSTGQVNALIPFDLAGGQTYQVIVNNNGALSAPAPLQTTTITPGVAAYASGYAEAQHGGDYSLITEASPAKPGEFIIIYLLGMGPTAGTVISGQPSPVGATTTNQPTVSLNGENVPNIPYSGLTPTAVGLYQINLQVPPDASNGDLPLIVNEAGVQTPPVILPVHN